MKFSFDPSKNAINIAKHGLSLADFEGFESVASIETDDRFEYGEVRYRGFGRIEGLGYSIAFAQVDDGFRLISFRRAHEKEMRRYE